MPYAMTIGADGRFDAVPNPVLRPMVAPAPLPPPGSMKKAARPVSQPQTNTCPSTPTRAEHAKGPLNLSEALQNQASVSTPSVPDTPATAAALAFIRRGRDQNMLSPSALRRTSVDSRGTAPLNVSQVSAATPSQAVATPAAVSVTGSSDLQAEVLHLRTKVGHLHRQLFESEALRNAGEAEVARRKAADKQEEEEAKRQIVAKLSGLRSLGEPIKYRLETLLDRGLKSSSPSEGSSASSESGVGSSRLASVAPSSQETRWSQRDLETLNGAVTQLGLLLEAQTTLAARVSALAALHPISEQVDTILLALDKAQAAQGALTLQLAQVTRERDELRDKLSSSSSFSSAPTLPEASSSAATSPRARGISGLSASSYRPSLQAAAGPVDVSGEDAASVPSDAGGDAAASRLALRSLEARPDAGLPGFSKAMQRIGATPSQVVQARVAGSSSHGVPLDDPDVDNEDVLAHERAAWNSFCHDLAVALSPLESQGSRMTKADVGGRGGLLWKEARSIAREHRGADWESERATKAYSQTRGAELQAFKSAFSRCTGHGAEGIPPMVLIKLYDRVTGPSQQG